MRKAVAISLLSLVPLVNTTTPALADPGSLDTTFGGDGKVLTSFSAQDAGASAIAFQPDGKIVIAGGVSPDVAFALARYNTDGTLDATFGDGGKVTTQFPEAVGSASVVAIQPDGKIIAGGLGALARYTTDGTLDPSFGGGDGVVVIQGQPIEIQTDGRIITISQGTMFRYLIDGTLDPSFGGGDGTVAVEGYILDIAIQADGKIVAIRNQVFVTRYNPDGSLDTAFGEGGVVSWPHFPGAYDWMNVVAIESDGTILVGGGDETCGGGWCDSSFELFRFTTDGIPVRSFGGSWKVMQEVQDIAIQSNGKTIAVGTWGEGRFALVRFKRDGSWDTKFAGDGVRFVRFNHKSGTLTGVALDADRRIVVFGTAEGVVHSKFALARYLAA